jgi:hypothetical protein
MSLKAIGCRHPVREPWIDLQPGVLHDLRGHQRRRADRRDLIVVAVQDESWNINLLEVLSKIRLREGLDTAFGPTRSAGYI